MVADGMLTRRRFREVPPRVEYELTERAQELTPILGELARWGYEWAWTAPRTSERVEIGAIFRLAPGLLQDVRDGSIEFKVDDAYDGDPMHVTLTASGGRVTIAERPAERPDARVSGTTEGWIRAFSPGGSARGLRIGGDRQLAKQVLDGLALSADRSGESADMRAA
jgi:hypothetical protein